MDLLFIDVETPNSRNDSICSIGLVRTSLDGKIVDQAYALVNPETRFDDTNMRVHGIAPVDVAGKPKFAEAWEEIIRPYMDGAFVVAHNAAYDLSVLSKSILNAKLPLPRITYACTQRMAREILSPDSCRLPDLCSRFGIVVERHHNALDDAIACGRLFLELSSLIESTDPYFSVYEPNIEKWLYRKVERPRPSSNGFIELVSSIARDGKVTRDEAFALVMFGMSNDALTVDPAFHRVFETASEITQDGAVTDDGSAALIAEIRSVLDPVERNAPVVFPGRRFCLTGEFVHGSKDDIKELIEGNGGTVLTGVTGKCDYVVVGSQGSAAYSFGNYGTKVKKGMELQDKGKPIRIISEESLYIKP